MAIELALHYTTEIISADSRQVYEQMKVGVGRPSEEELSKVPHHLIGHVDIATHYHASSYEKDALKALESIYQRNDIAILCGGTGLYIQTLCDGMDEVPPADMQIRNRLEEQARQEGIAGLQEFVRQNDPELAANIDMQNPKRLIRAVEVMKVSGRKFSSFRKGQKAQRNFEPIYICLEMTREELYARIHRRVDTMLEAGWLDEASSLYPYRHLKALQTVGYRELFGYIEGVKDWTNTVELIKTHTCQYARRQLTWFRRDKRYVWLQADEVKGYLVGRI